MAHTSTASSAPDAVPRVPGGRPDECGLVRPLQSVHAAAELVCRGRVVVLVSYVMSAAAVGRVCTTV